jgi:hypothetical protein
MRECFTGYKQVVVVQAMLVLGKGEYSRRNAEQA